MELRRSLRPSTSTGFKLFLLYMMYGAQNDQPPPKKKKNESTTRMPDNQKVRKKFRSNN